MSQIRSNNMRFLFISVVLIFTSCGQVLDSSDTKNTVVGSWKLMGMVKARVSIDLFTTEPKFIGGGMVFNSDNSFSGEVMYPRSPEKNMKVSGTYGFEDGILTINNRANNSTTQSRVEFEKDFMIATPLDPDGFTSYYKRSN